MEMTGEQLIAQPQQKVWDALNDPAVLKDCIPGCESIEKVSDSEYKIAMTASVGPVKAKFNGKLLISDLNPPSAYTLAFEGSGGAAGFGKGSAQVALAPDGEATRLTYTAKAQVGGKLAQVGARLIDGVAKKMADDFFRNFNARVAPAAPEAAPAPAAGAGAAPQPGAPAAGARQAVPSTGGKGIKPLWIIIALVVVIALIVLLSGRS